MTELNARVAIAVATYKRPDLAEALLQSLDAMQGAPEFTAIVVDNDPALSGVAHLEPLIGNLGFPVELVSEPRPGIAAARNKALDLSANFDYVCFIDDDELADVHWLAKLLEARQRYGADAVQGPVDSRFSAPPPAWALLGRFYADDELGEGERMHHAATNNLLFDRRAIEPFRFDDRFGITGGSDILMTTQFTRAGKLIIWTSAARVSEHVPAQRSTAKWLIRRATRGGNTHGRVRIVTASDVSAVRGATERFLVACGGVARVVHGTAQVITGLNINKSQRGARGFRRLLRGIGMVGSSFNFAVSEYRRAK